MIYREEIKSMIKDLREEAVEIELVEHWKDCDKAYDAICYVRPSLKLDDKEREAFGKAWVYKDFDVESIDEYYVCDILGNEENPAYLVRYWDDKQWEQWEEDPYGLVERWRECAGDDQHGEDAREATMEEYEEQVKEHKDYEEERFYDGYLDDVINEYVIGDNQWTGFFKVQKREPYYDEKGFAYGDWMKGVIKDKWFNRIDRMTDEMCKDIYERNTNVEKHGLKIGDLLKNSKTEALGIVIKKHDWYDDWRIDACVVMTGERKVKVKFMNRFNRDEGRWMNIG